MDSASGGNPGGGGSGRRKNHPHPHHHHHHRGPRKRNSNKRKVGGGVGGGGGGGSSNVNANLNNTTKKATVPPPPQTKLAIRNIRNPDKYGSTQSILKNMLVPLIEVCNNSKWITGATTSNSSQQQQPYVFEIDQSAMRYLIQEEELAKKYLEKERALNSNDNSKSPSPEAVDCDKTLVTKQNDSEDITGVEQTIKEEDPAETSLEAETLPTLETEGNDKNSSNDNELDIIVAPKLPSMFPVITVRPLYVIPPKKTRRRGERAGVVYVLLTAPKIEPIENTVLRSSTTSSTSRPENSAEEEESSSVSSSLSKQKQRQKPQQEQPVDGNNKEKTLAIEPPKEEDASNLATPKEMQTTEEDKDMTAPELVNEDTTIREQANTDIASSPPATPSMVTTATTRAPTADYSRAIAQGRLYLQRAVQSLNQVAMEDAKAQQEYATCRIETAMSGKTWRLNYNRPDRREGTIEATADFKNWLQSLSKQKEELKARPKPTPGGGVILPSSAPTGSGAIIDNNNGVNAENSGQPIAAIVQHLRAKRQEHKRKKAKKKKDKDKGKGGNNNKNKGGGDGGGGTEGGGGKKEGGRAAANKKKKKKAANINNNKKKGGGRQAGASVAPSGVLKAAPPTPSTTTGAGGR